MDNCESVLKATLCLLDAEQYLRNFEEFGIDSSVLPLLTASDLQLLGIENAELRAKLMQRFARLPVAVERNELVAPDAGFSLDVMNEIDRHLILLNASVCYAVSQASATAKRSHIRLGNAARCLLQCTDSLRSQALCCRKKVLFSIQFTAACILSRNHDKRKWKYVLCVLVSCTAAISFFRIVFTTNSS